MEITNKNIDGGNTFDWGRTSKEYAKYRDIYPDAFYERILARNLCVKGQKVLDLGTGTGVLPRNMYRYGANGPARISLKIRLRRPKGCPKSMGCISNIWLHRQRTFISHLRHLMSSPPANASGTSIIKRWRRCLPVC